LGVRSVGYLFVNNLESWNLQSDILPTDMIYGIWWNIKNGIALVMPSLEVCQKAIYFL